MQNKDKVLKEYVDIPEIFAEIANGYLFDGNRILNAENLEEYDTVIVSSKKQKEVRGDSRKFFRDGNLNICIENQSAVNYSMPVRVMLEDGLALSKEVRKFLNGLDEKGISYSPVSGGIKGMIVPRSVSIVLYTGNDVWDGAKELSELFDILSENMINEKFKKVNYNYPMGLIDAKHMTEEEILKYHGDIKILFKVLNFDEDERKECNVLDIFNGAEIKYKKSYEVMSVLTGDKRYIEYAEEIFKEEEGESEMCGLLDYVERRGRMSGIEEGINRGLSQGLSRGINSINSLNKKLAELGRGDDIIRAASDAEFQNKLINELEIKG